MMPEIACTALASGWSISPWISTRVASWSRSWFLNRFSRPLTTDSQSRRSGESPCYHCLFGEGEALEETRCATMGVFAPLVGIVGATQAGEALKIVAGIGITLAGRLLLIDARTMQWRDRRVPRDPLCQVCAVRRAPAMAVQRSESGR